MNGVEDAIARGRVIVCVGPGGVGKTTLGAALALDAASRGRRTAVLTIDPARRLADALRLDGLDDRLQSVARFANGGSLDAAMLDTKASYDALIERIAEPAARERILGNRVYQSFSRTLARSHAYVAMERLYAVLADGAHDLVVVDTPPTRSALDILDAPARLSRFLDAKVAAAFLGRSDGGAAAWLRAKGSEVALKLFGALAGEHLMGELASFFEVFFHLRHGFAGRANAMQEELRAPTTAFVLIAAPGATHLADAAYLRDGLLDRSIPLAAVVFNRAYTEENEAPIAPASTFDRERSLADACDAAGLPLDARARAIAQAAALVRARAVEDDREAAEQLRAFEVPTDVRALVLPRRDDPSDLDALLALWRARRPLE